jgi:hypothetical protein
MDFGDSDWFGVMIDSYLDHRTAFGFDVNPAGVRHDEIKTIDVDDYSWDPVWEAATTVDSAGWTAEYRIPFSQLRFSNAREQVWGVQFERIIGRNREYAVSTFIPKSIRGGVPQYGHLHGVQDIRPGKRIEALPYTVQRASYVDPGSNPYRDKPELGTEAGLDLLFRVSSNLTVNAAFNPDFGQVEVDPAVVNLGVYETFFDEKRPFFIEGSEIFSFGASGTSGGQLFYSRRVGRSPSLAPPTSISDVPDATTILGAAKVSGKPAGWSVGVLEALTAREDARFRVNDTDDRMTVEPMANYFVGRARREFRGGQSLFGGIVTAVNRDLASPQLQSALHNAAYAGGVDFRHEFLDRSWALFGDAELSHVRGSELAITATQRRSNHYFQRPDADHLEVDPLATSLTGYSVNLQLAKQGGRHWRSSLGAAVVSPKYEVNDLGFAVRTDRADVQAGVTYLQQQPSKRLRRWSVAVTGRSEHNHDWQSILNSRVCPHRRRRLYWNVHASIARFSGVRRPPDERRTARHPAVDCWQLFHLLRREEAGDHIFVSGRREARVRRLVLGVFLDRRYQDIDAVEPLGRAHVQPRVHARAVCDPGARHGLRRHLWAPLHLRAAPADQLRARDTAQRDVLADAFARDVRAAAPVIGGLRRRRSVRRAKDLPVRPVQRTGAEPRFQPALAAWHRRAAVGMARGFDALPGLAAATQRLGSRRRLRLRARSARALRHAPGQHLPGEDELLAQPLTWSLPHGIRSRMADSRSC